MLRRPHRARPLPWESESCRPVNQLQRLGERGLSRTGCSGAEGRSSAGSGTWAGPWGGPGEPPRGEGVQLGQRQRARPRAQSRTRVRAGSREAARSLRVVAGIAAPSAAGCARPAQPLRQSTHPPDYRRTHASPLPGARIRPRYPARASAPAKHASSVSPGASPTLLLLVALTRSHGTSRHRREVSSARLRAGRFPNRPSTGLPVSCPILRTPGAGASELALC